MGWIGVNAFAEHLEVVALSSAPVAGTILKVFVALGFRGFLGYLDKTGHTRLHGSCGRFRKWLCLRCGVRLTTRPRRLRWVWPNAGSTCTEKDVSTVTKPADLGDGAYLRNFGTAWYRHYKVRRNWAVFLRVLHTAPRAKLHDH